MSIKLRLVMSAIILLIVALGFNVLLMLNSLEKLYLEAIASQYSAIGKDLERNIEKALRFGKPIDKFIGMDKILEETKQNITREITEDVADGLFFASISSDISVSITLPDGFILYSTNEELVDTTLPEEARTNYENVDQNSNISDNYLKYGNTYIVSLPIRDMKKTWVGTAIITFDEKQIKTLLNSIRNRSIKLILLILAGSILLFILLFRLVTPNTRIDSQHFPKSRIYLIMLLVIGLAQVVFSVLNTNDFRNYYLQITREKTKTLTTLLQEDIEFLFSKGISINKLVKMDVALDEIIVASPELNDITILDNNDYPLYMATKKGRIDVQKATDTQLKLIFESLPSVIEPSYNIRLDLSKNNTVAGYISTNISKDVIFAKLWAIVLDSATILIISLLFFVEMLILLFQFIEQRIAGPEKYGRVHYAAIRPVMFMFFFGFDSSISFLPLHMENLYEPIFGFSKDMVMGLPISVEMFFAGLSIFIAGIWIDRKGWRQSYLSGLVLTGIGVLYSWQAPDALHFIISRGITGLGFGLCLMAAQGFIITSTDENSRAQGLAQLIAGTFAGSICGSAAGAMLAERVGYSPVFLVSAIIIFFVIGYIMLFFRKTFRKPEQKERHETEQVVQPTRPGMVVRFLFNRNVLSLIIFSSLPGALAIVGFLNYFSPIYLNRIGTTQSNIGRIFMINGLCLIYLAPFISKYIDASKNKKMYIVASGILGSLAFVAFSVFGGFVAVAGAAFLLSLSVSFGSNSQSSYILNLNVTKELGPGKAMGIYNSASRIGRVLGPMTLGWAIITLGTEKGISYFGFVYLLITVLFFLFTQSDRKIAVTEKSTM